MESALVHEVEAGFVAVEEGEIWRSGQIGESVGEAADLVSRRAGLFGQAVLEDAFLDSPGAAHAPISGCHFLDHAEFDAVDWPEALQMLGEKGFESGGRLVFEDDAIGEEAVAQRVEGGTAFALGGLGAFREGSVGAGSADSS